MDTYLAGMAVMMLLILPVAAAELGQGIADEHRVLVETVADPSGWGAQIDESVELTVLHVDDDALEASGEPGSKTHPYPTVGQAMHVARELLKAGTPVKVLIRDGVYHEGNLGFDAQAMGGKAPDTLLVIEGEAPGKVFLRGSETEGFEPATWTLVDPVKKIYRHDWKWNGMPPVDPDAYSPPTHAISRRREMVFINGIWLRQILLEQYDHEVKIERVPKPGTPWGRKRTIVTDTYVGYRDPVQTLQPGQFGVADLGPGEKDYNGHPHPNSIFLRLPEGVTTLEGATVEITHKAVNGLKFQNKNNLVIRNLIVEHYGAAAMMTRYSKNVLVEDCLIRYNEGPRGACALRIMNSTHATVRRCEVTWNGPFGFHGAFWNGRVEDSIFTYNNWRGGASGHIMHGAGGATIKGRQQYYRNCKFDHNYGFGARQDVQAENLIFENCSFNQNERSGGLMLEIALGPVLVENCQMLGNDREGLHVLNVHNVTVKDSIIANNGITQIDFFPMPHRTLPVKFQENLQPIGGKAAEIPVVGIQHFKLENSVLSTMRGADCKLIHWEYWGNNRDQYLDSLATFRASHNIYWNPGTTDVFGGGGKNPSEGTYVDLAQWRQMIAEDTGSVWKKPEGLAITGIRDADRIGIQGGEEIPAWEQ